MVHACHCCQVKARSGRPGPDAGRLMSPDFWTHPPDLGCQRPEGRGLPGGDVTAAPPALSDLPRRRRRCRRSSRRRLRVPAPQAPAWEVLNRARAAPTMDDYPTSEVWMGGLREDLAPDDLRQELARYGLGLWAGTCEALRFKPTCAAAMHACHRLTATASSPPAVGMARCTFYTSGTTPTAASRWRMERWARLRSR